MKKTETQLQQASQKVAIATLACGMIHDLNNILSSILGFAELAKMGISSGVKVDNDLDEVIKAGLKARNLVDQILTFIRQADVQKMPVEVTRLIKEAMKLIRALLPASIEISFHPGDFKGKVLADPVQFHQILIILCANASHAMKKKTGQIEISLKDTNLDDERVRQYIDLKPGQYLQLSIADTGNGMPKEIPERVCAPFRVPECIESAFPGLSLVQGIVREMGGAISVCNKTEMGTIFHILFPKFDKETDE
jgi:signal transduction histidine kinase